MMSLKRRRCLDRLPIRGGETTNFVIEYKGEKIELEMFVNRVRMLTLEHKYDPEMLDFVPEDTSTTISTK